MSIKVLVADDSITIQKVIGIIFGGDEYSLTVVDNGKSAVEKAREINPDILLIDALMPGMTGYEVSEVVRSIPALATKPILILTGSFEPFDEDKAKKCGADDFIAKPFESQQIITKVKELLELGKTRTLSAQSLQPPTSQDVFTEPVAEAPRTEPDAPATVPAQQPAVSTNIWDAFTPESASEAVAEPITEPVAAPVLSDSLAAAFEPDVFAIVTEENDAQLISAPSSAGTSPQHTGSQWVPVEEHTFEFVEETVALAPPQDFSDTSVPAEETAFGDIAFETEVAPPAEPAFAAFTEPPPIFEAPAAAFAPLAEPVSPPAPSAVSTQPETVFADFAAPEQEKPAAPFAPLSDPVPPAAYGAVAPVETVMTATSPVCLSEDQLRAAIAGASKEIIERIVWEVVPDLAEALIREAIRKIKQGV